MSVHPRWWAACVALILVGFLIATTPSPGVGQTMKLKHTGFRVLYMAPIYLAIEKGFFKEEGLDVEYIEIDSGILGNASLIGGQAHFSDTDPLQAAQVKDQGISLMMVYNLVNRVTLDFIMRTEVAERLRVTRQTPIMDRFRALRGLNIGITRPGAPTDVFPRYFMTRAGMNPDRDAQLVQVGGVAALGAALKSGRIDGFMLSPPLPQTLEREGAGRIIIKNTAGDVPELASVTYVAISVTEPFARHNPRLVRAYLRAVGKANAWMRKNTDEALKILSAKYFKDTPADVLKTSWEALLPAISADGKFSEAGIKGYLGVFDSVGRGVKADSAEGTLWSNQYLP